ncbi:LCP family protein [Helcobacillus sp. ACRRO]|uniref:LCP family protein n=1 Tax=Helcobacillus sp. ACRRO TaxID=2918202 RepID=UPI001EF5BAC9|nr:LCP family protein [Helcobacillus sp. ACRRO]MCG7428197.1 LCP family protein [Helcobacillus sp. ACRRO]
MSENPPAGRPDRPGDGQRRAPQRRGRRAASTGLRSSSTPMIWPFSPNGRRARATSQGSSAAGRTSPPSPPAAAETDAAASRPSARAASALASSHSSPIPPAPGASDGPIPVHPKRGRRRADVAPPVEQKTIRLRPIDDDPRPRRGSSVLRRAASGGAGRGGSGGRGGGRGPGGPVSPDGSSGQGGWGARQPGEGSLRRASLWTAASGLIPGLGLLPTPLRVLGIITAAVFVITVLSGLVWLLAGDPTATLIGFAFKPWFLTTAMITIALVAVIWLGLLWLTNNHHNRKERLQGPARSASRALAFALAIAIGLPAMHAAHTLWAANSLIGGDSFIQAKSGKSGEDAWKNVDRVNIMLLGQDAGADRTGTRPDTIMVASVDTKTGRTALFSIPRNLQYVRFPKGSKPAEVFPNGFDYYGKNQNLINAVWTWAEDVRPDLFPGDPNPGLTATTMAVEETLGLKVDYYAMVDLRGFEQMVDAIGGIDFEVERKIPIGGGAAKIDGYIQPGWQRLDGYHALWYARSREGSSDFDRNCRQQRIVRAVAEEADVPKIALTLPRLLNATGDSVVTDIPADRLDAFAMLAMRIQKGGFESYPINPSVTPSGNPDFDYLHRWVQESIKHSMETAPETALGTKEKDTEKSAQPSPKGSKDAKPATTQPADGASKEPSESPSPSAEPTESKSPTQSATPSESASTDAGSTPKKKDERKVELPQDPLKSCMPGDTDPYN